MICNLFIIAKKGVKTIENKRKNNTMSDIVHKNCRDLDEIINFYSDSDNICYIVGAGVLGENKDNLPMKELLFVPKYGDIVIAADGGYKYLCDAEIRIDYAIGDFDSLGSVPQMENVIKLKCEKDDTDMAAAIELGKKKGYKKFHIYGGLGGSVRHTLANIQAITSLAESGFEAYLIDENEVLSVVKNKTVKFDSDFRGFISVFSVSDSSVGVSIKNLKYEVQNIELTNRYPLGVSNEFISCDAEISVGDGSLLIMTDNPKTYIKKSFVIDENIKACIFDLDGTLLDSLHVWSQIDVDFLSKRGFEVPIDYMDNVAACGFCEAAEYTVKYFNLKESPQDLMDEWNEMAYREYSTNIRLKEGALEFLKQLSDGGYRLCVATSLPKHINEAVLKNNGVYDMFEFVASVDEVANGKSKPDIWEMVVSRLGLSAGQCVVFEDVLAAMMSAKSIGCRLCGVYDLHSDKFTDEIINLCDWFLKNYSQGETANLLKIK